MRDQLFIASLLVLLTFSIPVWVGLVRRLRSRESGQTYWLDAVIPRRPRIESPLGAIDVVALFVFWFLAQTIALGLFGPGKLELDSPPPPDRLTQTMLAVATGQLAGTLTGLLFIGLRHGYAPRIFGWQPEHFFADTRLALALFTMTLPPLLGLQWGLSTLIEYHHQTLDLLRDQATGMTLVVTWLSAGLIAPITEEIFFRGVLQAWLQRLERGMSQVAWLLAIGGGFAGKFQPPPAGRDFDSPTLDPPRDPPGGVGEAARPRRVLGDSDSIWMPILISSAAFGLVHLGQGLAPVTLFVFGLILGIVYRQTGSVWPCILLHMLLNAFSLFWVTLEAGSGSAAPAPASGWFFRLIGG